MNEPDYADAYERWWKTRPWRGEGDEQPDEEERPDEHENGEND